MERFLFNKANKVKSPEQRESRESSPGERAAEHALALVNERFKDGDPENRLAYHNSEHSESVIERSTRIAEALGLSAQDRELVTIAGAFHDTVQEWDEDAREGGVVLRKRRSGANEAASAEEAVGWMKGQEGRYTPDDYERVREAIMVTVAGWDAENRTANQPNLTPESSPVARSIALSDLGSAGLDPEVFSADGRDLFREEQLDIMRALQGAQSLDAISPEQQASYLERYQKWLGVQAPFAQGRKALFDKETASLDEGQRENLRSLFSHFDESIARAKQNHERALAMDFTALVHELIPDSPLVRG